MSNEFIALVIAILVLAMIGLGFLISKAPALGWILSIIFWIGVFYHWNKDSKKNS